MEKLLLGVLLLILPGGMTQTDGHRALLGSFIQVPGEPEYRPFAVIIAAAV